VLPEVGRADFAAIDEHMGNAGNAAKTSPLPLVSLCNAAFRKQ
jgi:hypothetical protein